jgi:hypothetical protein
VAVAAFPTARNSSSFNIRCLAHSVSLVRAIPGTMGERKSSERLACHENSRRRIANAWSAAVDLVEQLCDIGSANVIDGQRSERGEDVPFEGAFAQLETS